MSNIDVLLTEMTFNNRTWYLSQAGFQGINYYAPYLTKSPTLELGQIKGGYIGVRLGNVAIANRPNDRLSPFSIYSGGYAKLLADPTQKIPIKIDWQQQTETVSLFDGTMYLKTFGSDVITFLLEESLIDTPLLEEVNDSQAELEVISVTSATVNGKTVTVSAPSHDLTNDDLIYVSQTGGTTGNYTTPFGGKPVTVIDDSTFSFDAPQTTSGTGMTGPIYPADYPSVAIYNNTKAGAVGNVSAWQEAFHKNYSCHIKWSATHAGGSGFPSNVNITDSITITGMGSPFDGTHTVLNQYQVATNFHSSGTTAHVYLHFELPGSPVSTIDGSNLLVQRRKDASKQVFG